MKIYTKTGDQGTTSLINNTRIAKNHPRVEAYGTVDELNAHIGMLRDMTDDNKIADHLFEIQKVLFVVQTRLAIDPTKKSILCNPSWVNSKLFSSPAVIPCSLNATLRVAFAEELKGVLLALHSKAKSKT
jgi:hypothetical protein